MPCGHSMSLIGLGVDSGDTSGVTNGNGDMLGDNGDRFGDTFLSPLVSPLSPLCRLPTCDVGLVDNSSSSTSDIPRPSDVINSSLSPPNPNKPAICAHKLGFFCSCFAKYSFFAFSASSRNSLSAPAPLITTSLDRRSQ